MPQVVKLPTRRKEEIGITDMPVKSTGRHLKPVSKTPKTHSRSGIKVDATPKKKQVKTVVRKQKATPIPKAASAHVNGSVSVWSPVRSTMRITEMSVLDGLMQRVEVVDARGRKPKPIVYLTKGELEALTLGVQILQSTVKVKK